MGDDSSLVRRSFCDNQHVGFMWDLSKDVVTVYSFERDYDDYLEDSDWPLDWKSNIKVGDKIEIKFHQKKRRLEYLVNGNSLGIDNENIETWDDDEYDEYDDWDAKILTDIDIHEGTFRFSISFGDDDDRSQTTDDAINCFEIIN